jgi:YHS domain-containing protein
MQIVRLVVLGILFYIGWQLLKGIAGLKKASSLERGKKKAEADIQVEDVLVEDPVCHTLVPKNQAIRLRKDGETYYFCSDTCCDKFSETPREEE